MTQQITQVLLGAIVLALVYLIVEVNRLRVSIQPILEGSIGQFIASV